MPTPSPIELTFYNENDEVVVTHTRQRVPSYLFDMAIDLGSSMSGMTDETDTRPTVEKTAPLFDFLVELFGNKFTRDELKRSTDLGECLAVYQMVLARAEVMMRNFAAGNPIHPSPKKK